MSDVYKWIITEDLNPEPGAKPGTNGNAVGVMGHETKAEDLPNLKYDFRMYDDDGELYYKGKASHPIFDPLDDFGMPNAGATEIRYKIKGRWETL